MEKIRGSKAEASPFPLTGTHRPRLISPIRFTVVKSTDTATFLEKASIFLLFEERMGKGMNGAHGILLVYSFLLIGYFWTGRDDRFKHPRILELTRRG